MSNDVADDDVILIAPQVENQDGSQTFYILDPCSSSPTNIPSKIELIDLTAEIKNTGAIAVLSTNSDTGALELTLTKSKITEEDMESVNKNNLSQSGESPSSVCLELKQDIFIDDDLDKFESKDEENEDVDIEEIHEDSDEKLEEKNESGSINLELESSNEDIPNEQDDEIDEDTLYIDDAKFAEELARENLENLRDMIINNKKKALENTNEILINSKEATIPSEDVNKFVEEIGKENPKKDELNIENKSQHELEAEQLSIIYHKEESILPDMIDDNEYVESTNTALTLLELAGGTSLRQSTHSNESDVEVIESENNENSQEAKHFADYNEKYPTVSVVDNAVPPNKANEGLSDVSSTTLITLQPVPLDPPVSVDPHVPEDKPVSLEAHVPLDQPIKDSTSLVPDKDPSSLTLIINSKVEPQKKTNVPLTPKVDNSYKMHSEIQKLIEGDTPRLGMQVGKIRSASISSPIVTQDDIAKEILARSIQKCPYTEPSGGDLIFTKKLAYRLASRIVSPEKVVSSSEDKSPGCATFIDKPMKIQDKSQDSISGVKPPSTLVMKTDCISNSNGNNSAASKKDAISDKIELLKILEDDPDDPSSDLNEKLLEQRAKMKMTKGSRPPLIKLHPELEKELALKQLEDFSKKGRKRKVGFPDAYKNMPKNVKILKKNQEHNNNLNSKNIPAKNPLPLKKNSNLSLKNSVTFNNGTEENVTVDPSQVTETLPIEQSAEIQPKDTKFLKQYSNKRHSRNSETPPREIPMEILLNGEEDDLPQGELNTSKNKIFKATHPRKRQEELKIKRQKHFANVLQRNPQKRRGRPPKKKSVLSSDDFLPIEVIKQMNPKKTKEEITPEVSNNSESNDTSTNEKPQKTKKMREIERLLGDEGAINMLYSVEQKRTIGGEPKRGILPSYRRKKKDLILKTKLVKSAVLKLTTSPLPTLGRVSLRGQPNKDEDHEENLNDTSLRKMSVDSHDSHISLSSPPNEVFSFPAKIVPAEASRIIRRHSSSSNYSSRSNSPRRASIDGERSSIILNDSQILEPSDTSTPINCNKSQKSKQLRHDEPNDLAQSEISKDERPAISKGLITAQGEEIVENKKRIFRAPISEKIIVKPPSSFRNAVGRPRKNAPKDDMKKTTELNTSLAAAVDDFTKENENTNKNIPMETPTKSFLSTNTKASTSRVYRKTPANAKTVKQEKQSVVYNEITLKRQNYLVEIVLTPVTTKLKNAMNAKVLQELTSVLNGLGLDDNCRLVLFTSCGSVFCQGVDFFSLIQPTAEKRKTAALEMAVAVKDFIKTVAMFTKPLVAGVHGPAVGLGTTMLPLFDLIYAGGEATFHTPYARLGQVPEGAATLTLPSLLGAALTSELLFACRKLTAAEAVHHGLVTRILQSDNFHEELLTIATGIASQSTQSMGATKALLRHNLLSGLETTLVSETHLLIQHWTSDECQANFNKYLQDEEQSLSLQTVTQPT